MIKHFVVTLLPPVALKLNIVAFSLETPGSEGDCCNETYQYSFYEVNITNQKLKMTL